MPRQPPPSPFGEAYNENEVDYYYIVDRSRDYYDPRDRVEDYMRDLPDRDRATEYEDRPRPKLEEEVKLLFTFFRKNIRSNNWF